MLRRCMQPLRARAPWNQITYVRHGCPLFLVEKACRGCSLCDLGRDVHVLRFACYRRFLSSRQSAFAIEIKARAPRATAVPRGPHGIGPACYPRPQPGPSLGLPCRPAGRALVVTQTRGAGTDHAATSTCRRALPRRPWHLHNTCTRCTPLTA